MNKLVKSEAKITHRSKVANICKLAVLLATWPMLGQAQVPVDDYGNPVGDYHSAEDVQDFAEPDLVSDLELENLVGSIALYPDDLLAIILPASTYPLQLVEAARFLEELEKNPSLQPDEDWDDSVVALTNYPEVIQLLNEDLDWTWQLGEAVVAQQADVIAAIEIFRDRAYVAGNLKSDEYQQVTHDEGIIEITPVNDEVIYVPYYEPERVVVYQPQPVYYYHPRPYPVYNYPYPYGHSFRTGYFWGVTTAFTIGWATDYLHVYHHSYNGHPYYGYHYNTNWWYRRPSINVHNTYYTNNSHHRANNYYQNGDQWRSNNNRHFSSGQQITQTRHRSNSRTKSRSSFASSRSGDSTYTTSNRTPRNSVGSTGPTTQRRATTVARNSSSKDAARRAGELTTKDDIRFRQRSTGTHNSSTRNNGNQRISAATNKSVRTSPTRTAVASNIQFKPRSTETKTATTRQNRAGSSQNSVSSRSTAATRNKPAKVSQSTPQRQTASQRKSTRIAAAHTRPSTNKTRQTVSSNQRSSAPSTSSKRPANTQQRQAAPAQKKPQKSDAGSRSKSATQMLASNSRNRSAGNKNKSNGQRRH